MSFSSNLLMGFRTVFTKYSIKVPRKLKKMTQGESRCPPTDELPSSNRGSSKRDTKLHEYIFKCLYARFFNTFDQRKLKSGVYPTHYLKNRGSEIS